MKVIFLIIELSFIISKEVENWLTNEETLDINLLEYNNYNFYANLEINQRITVFITFDSEKYIFQDNSLTFYEFKDNNDYILKSNAPFTKIKEGNITTLVAVYIASELKTKFIDFKITPSTNIRDATIHVNIYKNNIPRKIVETFLRESEIINLNEFSSLYFYKFKLTAGYNSKARLELIFDTKRHNYKNFYLSHIFEYQYNKIQKILYLPNTVTKQGNKTILTISHPVADAFTTSVVFQLVPSYSENNVNILGFEDKEKSEYKNILFLDYSLKLTSMYPSIYYYIMYPIKTYQTDQIKLRISNITSFDYYSQPVDVYECWYDSFGTCKKIKSQKFTMTKNNDSTIFLESYYQNKNYSINHIVFAFKPLYNFYDVAITGSIRENDPEPEPDPEPDPEPEPEPDSGSSGTVVLVSIISSCIIISIIVVVVLYFFIKKRRSKEINFDKRNSIGNNFLLNE